MSRISGLVQGWSFAEDELLLRFLHVSQPGGRFGGPREFATWPIIAENMTGTAPTLGITRTYTRQLCAMRYSRYILPHMTLAAAQNRPGLGPTFSDAPSASGTTNPYHSVLHWIADLRLADSNTSQPEDTAWVDLVTWDNLVQWAKKVVEHPGKIFTDEGTVPEFDVNPEVAPAGDNPWDIKAQYELDFFKEILGWAQNIVRQDGKDEQNQRSSLNG